MPAFAFSQGKHEPRRDERGATLQIHDPGQSGRVPRLDRRATLVRTPEEQAAFDAKRTGLRLAAEERSGRHSHGGRVWQPFPGVREAQAAAAIAVFTVNTDFDDPDITHGDGFCYDGFANGTIDECTLRAAIQEANATPGSDPVVIRIDMISPARGAASTVDYDGVHDLWTLLVNTDASVNTYGVLPALTRDNVLIDATTQLDGSGIGSFPDAYCGQPVLGDTNVVKVAIDGSLLGGGADVGLEIQADTVEIRGLAVKNFPGNGIFADGAQHFKVDCSYLGTDHLARAAAGNGSSGLAEQAGSDFRITNSIASANGFAGVYTASENSMVDSSFFGSDVTGLSALGNADAGVLADGGAALIKGNTAAFNSGAGVEVESSGPVSILQNALFSNTGLGIDLAGDGVTANDAGVPPDLDAGPNGLQNFPVINGAAPSGPTTVTVSFDFESAPNAAFRFDYYRSATPDPSGFGEGAVWLKAHSAETDASGMLSEDQDLDPTQLPPGSWVTMTATDSVGETSEFSQAFQVVGSLVNLSSAKVFLEGPYSAGAMVATLSSSGYVPLLQPYADSMFDGTLQEVDDSVTVEVIPANVVDWVTVSLRTGTDPASEVARQVAFLRDDGTLLGVAGDPAVSFAGIDSTGYRIIVCHRNHLCAMSSSPVDFSSGMGTWDFTTALGQAYSAGGAPMKDLGGGKFGLFASDSNADGQTTALDFGDWISSTTAGETGYRRADFNLDGMVTALDFSLWIANTTAGAASRVPE